MAHLPQPRLVSDYENKLSTCAVFMFATCVLVKAVCWVEFMAAISVVVSEPICVVVKAAMSVAFNPGSWLVARLPTAWVESPATCEDDNMPI